MTDDDTRTEAKPDFYRYLFSKERSLPPKPKSYSLVDKLLRIYRGLKPLLFRCFHT
ncbi:hypothetical protein [Nostoc sp. NZL]|uniref:hypothetical protein n=1 Tax=Nostoc sp. NZL TaxID=2650612 RepID=UPI0018C65780|nr:hypothetical protein [Nostoc sp. NZL]